MLRSVSVGGTEAAALNDPEAVTRLLPAIRIPVTVASDDVAAGIAAVGDKHSRNAAAGDGPGLRLPVDFALDPRQAGAALQERIDEAFANANIPAIGFPATLRIGTLDGNDPEKAAALADMTVNLHVIPDSDDHIAAFGVGHQWKLVLAAMRFRSFPRVRHRLARMASSSPSVSKWRLTMGSSTSGQRCSAGWSSGV